MVDTNCESEVYLITVKVNGMNTVNVYKPPTNSSLQKLIKIIDNQYTVYIGDSNSNNNLWRYKDNDEKIFKCAKLNNLLHLFKSSKDKHIFLYRR